MKTVIKLLSECNTKKAEKESNGYYVVTEQWNTCFHRWANNITDRIEVRQNSIPEVAHTYTRIPAILKSKVFFVYVNCLDVEGFTIELKEKEIIIGGYEPQKSGGFLNYSYFIYSPIGEQPVINSYSENGCWIKHPNMSPIKFRMEMLCPASINVRSFKVEDVTQGCA